MNNDSNLNKDLTDLQTNLFQFDDEALQQRIPDHALSESLGNLQNIFGSNTDGLDDLPLPTPSDYSPRRDRNQLPQQSLEDFSDVSLELPVKNNDAGVDQGIGTLPVEELFGEMLREPPEMDQFRLDEDEKDEQDYFSENDINYDYWTEEESETESDETESDEESDERANFQPISVDQLTSFQQQGTDCGEEIGVVTNMEGLVSQFNKQLRKEKKPLISLLDRDGKRKSDETLCGEIAKIPGLTFEFERVTRVEEDEKSGEHTVYIKYRHIAGEYPESGPGAYRHVKDCYLDEVIDRNGVAYFPAAFKGLDERRYVAVRVFFDPEKVYQVPNRPGYVLVDWGDFMTVERTKGKFKEIEKITNLKESDAKINIDEELEQKIDEYQAKHDVFRVRSRLGRKAPRKTLPSAKKESVKPSKRKTTVTKTNKPTSNNRANKRKVKRAIQFNTENSTAVTQKIQQFMSAGRVPQLPYRTTIFDSPVSRPTTSTVASETKSISVTTPSAGNVEQTTGKRKTRSRSPKKQQDCDTANSLDMENMARSMGIPLYTEGRPETSSQTGTSPRLKTARELCIEINAENAKQ